MKKLLSQPIIPSKVSWYKAHKDAGARVNPQHVFWTELLAKMSFAITMNQTEVKAFL
jgi:ribosomal protein L24E